MRFFLSGNARAFTGSNDPTGRDDVPDDCLIDFDMRVIDLFAEMDKKHRKILDLVRDEYYRVKEQIGHRPSRMDLFTYMDDEIYQLAISHAKDNPFKRYMEFLKSMGELTLDEQRVYGTIGREFIDVRMEVTEAQLLESWKKFFNDGTNWKDLEPNQTYEQYKSMTDQQHIRKIMQMPVHFLLESGKGFFVEKEGCALALKEEMRDVIGIPGFAEQMGDAIRFRAVDYYRRRYNNDNERL